ncbi:glycosyltransferase family 25 protein [Hypoxylon trugodes]|uniref:glycosyltransferase family 25 protein n=1 Tax=Hypoxylon trugodes TaxID=326681 RepID=UPI00219FE44A|nr:glycosyltransferase family 25 protein [Hypoxylon trugodes]KAI1392016.1 glycosyltransferase family 25 protein [Hypoxylon trugodes]
MQLYHRVFAAICVFTPLLYIYWRKLTTPDAVGIFRGRSPTEDVFNNTLSFSKIFVINLPSRTDRRDAMALSGAVSNLTFTWIGGVSGEQATGGKGRSSGAKGSWRSHMNALRTIVSDDIRSALVVEDDIDWDIRIKSQLQTFASASRTWLKESKFDKRQELLDYVPPSLLKKGDSTTMAIDSDENTIRLNPSARIDNKPHESVYGDDWDVLWLGHCGADLPDAQAQVSPLRVAILGDETVPSPKHLKPHPFALKDKLGEIYPPHTRVVHASSGNVCSLAYAVSFQGARKLLSEFERNYDKQWDLMLQKWCEGGYIPKEKPQSGSEPDSEGARVVRQQEKPPICLTVQPPLFSHHYAKGGASDIQGQGGGYAKGTGTPYIRFSVRENLRRLVTGATVSELVDQLPDDGKTIW